MKTYQKIKSGLRKAAIVATIGLSALAPAYAEDKAQEYVEEKPALEEKIKKYGSKIKKVLGSEIKELDAVFNEFEVLLQNSPKEGIELIINTIPKMTKMLCKACNEDPEMYKVSIQKTMERETDKKEEKFNFPDRAYDCEYICTLNDLLSKRIEVKDLNEKIEDYAENYEFLKAGDLTLVKLSYRIFKSAELAKQFGSINGDYVSLSALHLCMDGLEMQEKAVEFYLKGGDIKTAKELSGVGMLVKAIQGEIKDEVKDK